MATSAVPTYVRRYTDLPALLHMLTARKLTLLDPKTWDDRNDSYFMSLYKERKKLKTVLALCFSQTVETYHHWRVFSNGPAGICVVFDRAALLKSLSKVTGLTTGSMDYLTVKDAKSKTFKVDELPFLKRYGYKPESEFRALYVSSAAELPFLDVEITLDCIRSVSLSPWMHTSLSASTVASIKAIDGFRKLRVSRSTLISNEQWKQVGRAAA